MLNPLPSPRTPVQPAFKHERRLADPGPGVLDAQIPSDDKAGVKSPPPRSLDHSLARPIHPRLARVMTRVDTGLEIAASTESVACRALPPNEGRLSRPREDPPRSNSSRLADMLAERRISPAAVWHKRPNQRARFAAPASPPSEPVDGPGSSSAEVSWTYAGSTMGIVRGGGSSYLAFHPGKVAFSLFFFHWWKGAAGAGGRSVRLDTVVLCSASFNGHPTLDF